MFSYFLPSTYKERTMAKARVVCYGWSHILLTKPQEMWLSSQI